MCFYEEASFAETRPWGIELICQCPCSIRASQCQWPNRRITEKPLTHMLACTRWNCLHFTHLHFLFKDIFHAYLERIWSCENLSCTWKKHLPRHVFREKVVFFIQRWDRLWPGTKEMIVKPLMKLQSETLLFLKFILISAGLLHVNGLWCQIKHNGSLSAGLINREESPPKGFVSHLRWLILLRGDLLLCWWWGTTILGKGSVSK